MLGTLEAFVGPWLPDLPDYKNPGSTTARNVIPRTSRSYGPVSALTAFAASALTKRCQGAASFIDGGGNVYLFAGDANDLYMMTAATNDWAKVSKVAGGYSTPPDGFWQFEFFNGYVVATNFTDAPQKFLIGTDAAFSDLNSGAPKGRYVATVKSFLVLANTSDATDGAKPQRVWWSAAGDATSASGWPTPGGITAAQVQSSRNDLLGRGGWIQGIVGNLGNADAAVFQEHAVWRMNYSAPPIVFDFQPAEGVKGCPAPNSIVQVGSDVYYLGEDGFYRFDGARSYPIGGDRVDKTFFGDLDQGNIARVVGSVDVINKAVWWAYPGSGNSGGNPNHLMIYHIQLDRWSIVDTAVETLVRMLSLGYTLDQLHTVLGYTLDNLPAPLDSRIWTGGALLFGAFDTNHKLAYFTGQSLAAEVDTAEIQPFTGRRTFVNGTRPLVDGGTPSIQLGVRERTVDPVTWKPAGQMNGLGICPQRFSGRYTRARITTRAGDGWQNLQGAQLDAKPMGAR